PMFSPALSPKPMPSAYVEPGTQGGTNWYSPSFSPRTGLFYVSTWENYSNMSGKGDPGTWREGGKYTGNARTGAAGGRGRGGARFMTSAYRKEEEGYGAVRALDPQTGQKKWDFKMVDYTESGILTTASDLLFSGGREGNFFALDARTGEPLWKVGLGGTVA